MSWCKFLWIYSVLGLLSFLDLLQVCICHIGEVFSHYFFKYYFSLSLVLLSFWSSSDMNVGFLLLPHSSPRLLICFSLFFLCCLDGWVLFFCLQVQWVSFLSFPCLYWAIPVSFKIFCYSSSPSSVVLLSVVSIIHSHLQSENTPTFDIVYCGHSAIDIIVAWWSRVTWSRWSSLWRIVKRSVVAWHCVTMSTSFASLHLVM